MGIWEKFKRFFLGYGEVIYPPPNTLLPGEELVTMDRDGNIVKEVKRRSFKRIPPRKTLSSLAEKCENCQCFLRKNHVVPDFSLNAIEGSTINFKEYEGYCLLDPEPIDKSDQSWCGQWRWKGES